MEKRLLRSTNNKWVGGVCGGIAEYFGWNADPLRLVWVIMTFFTVFSGGILYLVLWMIMPKADTYLYK